jgi:hypothetical protein
MMTDEEISELLHDIGVVYSDQKYLMEFLTSLNGMSMVYAAQTQGHGQKQTQNAEDQKHKLMAM